MDLSLSSVVAVGAAVTSVALGLIVLLPKQRSPARWFFAVGMLVLAAETALNGLSLQEISEEEVVRWQSLAFVAKSFLPGLWLCFSLTFARGQYREFLRRWSVVLAAAFILPLATAALLRGPFLDVIALDTGGSWVRLHSPAKLLNALLLLGALLVLTNLEKTFRAAVGTMQWRIKFLVLGVAIIFGTRIYTRCQTPLFSGHSLGLVNVESCALLLGCAVIIIGYRRSGFAGVDVYPSRAILQTSFTLLFAGTYLFVVGVLAQIVAHRGGSSSFPLQAFVVLLGIALLAVLLLSDRLRQQFKTLVSRHFRRPEHDFRQIWTAFTRSVSSLRDEHGVASAVAKLLSSTFNALSVSVFLFEDSTPRLRLAASTIQTLSDGAESCANVQVRVGDVEAALPEARPFYLEKSRAPWAEPLRDAVKEQFDSGGNRLCVPLLVRERCLGFVTLADRVGGSAYTVEEIDLLQCLADQLSNTLLNIRLTDEILQGRELEAFQTMSTFFVHDLKNAASTLTLTLQNLPVHFDDPAFREDALRGIGKTVTRINRLIERLGALRRCLAIDPVELDLNAVIEQTLETISSTPDLAVEKELGAVPPMRADREQLQSVFTNLFVNAREAVSPRGRVSVCTETNNGWAVVSVSDTGCGMSSDFVRDSLFRPFKTTKKNGLGIGMFQSKMIVEAHGGKIDVESETGAGTTFRVFLPLSYASS